MTGAISPSFINADAEAPGNFRDLARQRHKDPDSGSTLIDARPRPADVDQNGLWRRNAPAIWEGLSDNIVTVTKGWSEAYGLFLEGEADMVLSYTTSPAYHLIAEEDDRQGRCRLFEEGHYMQVEVAAKLAASRPETTWPSKFLAFMVSDTLPVRSSRPPTGCIPPSRRQTACPKGLTRWSRPEKSLLLEAG